ncbi:MAG: serine protease [Verrucomicrobiota bacterium]
MLRLSIALILLLPGCAAPEPPDEEVRRSSAMAGTRQISRNFPGIRRSAFIVFSSDEPIGFDFTSAGSSFHWESDSPGKSGISSGLATALTTDGYLLTAAHVVRQHCGAVGFVDGRLQPVRCRLVGKGRAAAGEDFAVLHMEGLANYALPLSRFDPESDALYAFSLHRRKFPASVDILYGRLLEEQYQSELKKGIILCDIPFYAGDSGGGVLTAGGKLIGLNLGWGKRILSARSYRRVYIPDRERINQMIQEDRTRRQNRKDPAG